MRAAMEAAAKAAAATAAVRLKELQGSSVMPLGRPAGLDLRGDTPAFVQGGPLLAVTVTRAVQSPAQELAIPGVRWGNSRCQRLPSWRVRFQFQLHITQCLLSDWYLQPTHRAPCPRRFSFPVLKSAIIISLY